MERLHSFHCINYFYVISPNTLITFSIQVLNWIIYRAFQVSGVPEFQLGSKQFTSHREYAAAHSSYFHRYSHTPFHDVIWALWECINFKTTQQLVQV